jgi:hypothetical protein
MIERSIDVPHDVPAVHEDRPLRSIAQRDVEHRAMFGGVDAVAGEHAIAQRLDAPFACELPQQLQRLVSDEMLRVVDEHATEPAGQPIEAIGVGGKPLP